MQLPNQLAQLSRDDANAIRTAIALTRPDSTIERLRAVAKDDSNLYVVFEDDDPNARLTYTRAAVFPVGSDTPRYQDIAIRPWEYRAVIDRVIRWNGLEIGLEHPPGSVRFPGANAHKLKSAYGHLRGLALAGDRKAPDCYLHRSLLDDPDSAPRTAWRIQQLHPDTGEPDEHKIMLGYDSERDARDAYLFEMPSDKYFGGIAKMPLSALQRADYAEPRTIFEPHDFAVKADDVLSDEEWDAIAAITDDDIDDAVETMGDEPDFATETDFDEALESAINEAINAPYEFAAKKPKVPSAGGKKKNCTPGKSHFCQKPGGAGACIPITKKCGYTPDSEVAIAASNYLGDKAEPKKDLLTTPLDEIPDDGHVVDEDALNSWLNKMEKIWDDPDPDSPAPAPPLGAPPPTDRAAIREEFLDLYDLSDGTKSPDDVQVDYGDTLHAYRFMATYLNKDSAKYTPEEEYLKKKTYKGADELPTPLLKKMGRMMDEAPDMTAGEAAALGTWLGSNYAQMNRRLYAPTSFTNNEVQRAIMTTNLLAAKALQKVPRITEADAVAKAKAQGRKYDPKKPLERHLNMPDPEAFVKRYQDAMNGDGGVREETFFGMTYLVGNNTKGINWVKDDSNITYRVKPRLDGQGQGRYVDHFKNNMKEGEILFPPQSKFKVTGIKQVGFKSTAEQDAAKKTIAEIDDIKLQHGSKWKSAYKKATGKAAPNKAELDELRANLKVGKLSYIIEMEEF